MHPRLQFTSPPAFPMSTKLLSSLPQLRRLFTFSALTAIFFSINPFNPSWSSDQRPVSTALDRRPWKDARHAFKGPTDEDARSPCPALNTLANHGFINRSGKEISRSALTSSLTSIYRLSVPLAELLVTGGFLCCADFESEGLSLDALAAHDKIEHDASLVHDNTPLGAAFAPIKVNWTLVNELTTKYPDGLGIRRLSEARATREELSRVEGRPKLDALHGQIAYGEAALTWLVMKDLTSLVRTDTIRQWFGQETFPETFVIPSEEITLHTTSKISSKIGQHMKEFQNHQI
ncbi:hypothetical protein D9757_006460 [Collybiopsis confluens]|uniref:Heme haloperoxidase family profile domain-containing protein n=1 Tax=Collybiopsis confluens TaxID=2823264 RepID=A0A8H5HK22_9AGAR|nr:hypothetical protein D9757_006460 [Collybiopsis confluens]